MTLTFSLFLTTFGISLHCLRYTEESLKATLYRTELAVSSLMSFRIALIFTGRGCRRPRCALGWPAAFFRREHRFPVIQIIDVIPHAQMRTKTGLSLRPLQNFITLIQQFLKCLTTGRHCRMFRRHLLMQLFGTNFYPFLPSIMRLLLLLLKYS